MLQRWEAVHRSAERGALDFSMERVEQAKARKVKAVLALRAQGVGIRRIAREVGLGVGTVLRLVEAGGPSK